MKFLFTIFTIFAILSLVMASNVFEKDFSDPAHPGKCVISEDLILDPGHHSNPTNKCIFYECREDGTAQVIASHPAGCQDKIPPPTTTTARPAPIP